MSRVSVVIPVYNVSPYLHCCLDSVLAQTHSDLEVVCVDDGSTDDSPAVLDEYVSRDGRVQVFRQANMGPGIARNCGLEQVSGEYVIFLDSDDWFEPNFIEIMLKNAEFHQADITICRADEFDNLTKQVFSAEWMLKKELTPGECFSPREMTPWVFQFTYGMAWDKLYSYKFIKKQGLSFPNLRNSEDLAFVFPSILAANKICIADKVLIHHRVNRMSSVSNSRASAPDAPYEAFKIVRQYLEVHMLLNQYEQSFLNWAMEFLIWHVSNISDLKFQRACLKQLKSVWFPELKFDQHPRNYYRNRFNYAKYLLAKYTPFYVFHFVVSIYKTAKRLLMGRGEKVAAPNQRNCTSI